MKSHIPTCFGTTQGGDTTTKTGANRRPRARLRGGDLPRGGRPASTGHAGRPHLAKAWAVLAIVALVASSLATLPAGSAYAASEVRFPNGKTVTQTSDGKLKGTAHIGDWDDDIGTHFPVTMPDGTKTYGWCQDHMHFAPAPGDYPFVATPRSDGSYDVLIDSSGAPNSVRQVETSSPLLSPPQRVGDFTWSPVLMGELKLEKSSALTALTVDNSCYSLSKARYGIWEDKACTKSLGSSYDLVTKEDGTSNVVYLEPGTYYIKEKTAPKGFGLDDTVYKVKISSNERTTKELTEEPLYETPELWATKQDAELMSAQGSATLEGAEFTVRYFDGIYDESSLPQEATRTWVIRTDSSGHVMPTPENLVQGSPFYYNDSTVVLPLGTIAIQETKAPAGYWLEGQDASSPADYAAPVHVTTVDGSGSYETIVANESVRRAGLSLKKEDSQTGASTQGDASLAGISFSIINRNEQAVVVGGATYEPGAAIGDPLVTNEQGFASTASNYLPVGTYEVREVATNDSMLLTAEPQVLTLGIANTNTVVALARPFANDVVRGGVRVGKISRETGKHLSQGEASLKGAVFVVSLGSQQPVVVNGATRRQGEAVCTITTNEEGIAQTDKKALPYGTYTVREETPPAGFLPNTSWSRTFQVRKDGVVVDLSAPDTSVDDQVMRGGFSFNKVEEETMERMPLTAFLLTSTTTGESHVLVSDENGVVDTEVTPHSKSTNANDAAYDGKTVKEDKLNPEAGVWFSGRKDLQVTPNDSFRALPYDVYRVTELPSSVNEGHSLVSFTVRIHKNNVHVDMGTVDDAPTPQVSMGTTLSYNDLHLAPAQEQVSLVDVVSYEGLEPGMEYELQGSLYVRERDEFLTDQNGEPITQTMAFTPKTRDGKIDLTFVVDTTKLEGTSLVAFESITQGGREVASHREPDDEGQTVHIPNIGTTLTTQDGGKNPVAGNETLVDTVSYHNLIPGMQYVAEGVLMCKATNEPLRNEAGQEVRASTSFVPEESDGTVQVTFVLDDSAVGKGLVAFETLTRASVELAWHNDIEDEDQTVYVPSIQTEFTDEDGNHLVSLTETLKLKDTVSYTNLVPGESYTLSCVLVSQQTGEPLQREDGTHVEATATFVPESASGTADVWFELDGSLVAGQSVVAFETLLRDDTVVAVHADKDDEGQTIRVPRIGTVLVSKAGTHEVAGTEAELVDTVEYEGLVPGDSYLLEGTLVSKGTGTPLEDSQGNVVQAQANLVPQEASGVAEVTFIIDASRYEGTSVVAFEFLHEGDDVTGRTVAQHADVTSTEQTVQVPRIRTTAKDVTPKSKSKKTGTTNIEDTVEYQGLEPGATYVMHGTLHQKESGEAVTRQDGTPIEASKTFTAEEQSGTVVIDFSLDVDLVKGDAVVVFESCLREGVEVATHADKDDESQTVTVQKPTPSKKTPSPSKKTPSPGSPDTNQQKSPSTGDSSSYLLALGCATFGAALLMARRLLRR